MPSFQSLSFEKFMSEMLAHLQKHCKDKVIVSDLLASQYFQYFDCLGFVNHINSEKNFGHRDLKLTYLIIAEWGNYFELKFGYLIQITLVCP